MESKNSQATVMDVENITNEDFRSIKTEQEARNVIFEEVESVNKQTNPENYHEIYGSYKKKDYEECLSLIENCEEYHTEYQILRSACIIHLGEKVCEAHKILDDVLETDPDNAFTIYAKGLAYYHEENWEKSLEYFRNARMLNPTTDMERAEIMMEKAEEKLYEHDRSTVITTRIPTFRRSTGSSHIVRRFGCEICNHYFGKKFNLDRHNQSIHNRETPDNFPTHSKYPYKGASPKQKRNPESPLSRSAGNSPVIVKKSPIPSPPAKEIIQSTPAGTLLKAKGKVRCNVCRKLFKKSSISRHVIIHSGNKAHKCDQCPMAFFQKSDLSRHIVSFYSRIDLKLSIDCVSFRFRQHTAMSSLLAAISAIVASESKKTCRSTSDVITPVTYESPNTSNILTSLRHKVNFTLIVNTP